MLPNVFNFLSPTKSTPQVMYSNLGDPKEVSNEYNKDGAEFQMFGDFKSAIECYEKALEKNP